MMMKQTTTTTTKTNSGSITTHNNNSTQGQGQKDQLLESASDMIRLPGTSNGNNAREVICAVQHDNCCVQPFIQNSWEVCIGTNTLSMKW